jgi:hypothetical protein
MPAISIIEAFADLPNPRMDRSKRHSLSDIVVRTLCGALCAVDNWVELERFCGLFWPAVYRLAPSAMCNTVLPAAPIR